MKVALIQPHHNFADLAPPLCLGYLTTYARRVVSEAEFKIVNLSMGDNLKSALGSFEPDIIGVTGSTPIAGSQAKLLTNLRSQFPKSRIFVGGPHASTAKSDLLEFDIDGVVVGEGEATFADILKACGDPDGIPGVLTRKGDFKERPKIKDLDTIPFPDRTYYNMGNYKIQGAIVTSRGCPYSCTFCCQGVTGKSWRGHSPEYVVDEIEYLVRNYKVSSVRMMEDNPVLQKKRIVRICELLNQRGLAKKIRVENNSGIRADLVDDEMLIALKSVGLDVVWIGLESADPDVLKAVLKELALEQMEKAVMTCKKHGLMVSLYVTVGMQGDTLEKNRETLEFVKRMKADNCIVGVATPYPGTALKDWVDKHGRWIERDYKRWYGHIDVDESPPFDTEDFPLQERMEAIRMWHKYIARQHASIAIRHPVRAFGYAFKHPRVVLDSLRNIIRI